MYCSSVFGLVLVANLALSGAILQRNPIPNYNTSPAPLDGNVISNYGNGNGNVNEIVVNGGSGYAKSQPFSTNLGNRFGEETQIRGGQPGYQGSIISNIVNGNGNRNTIVSTNNGQRTLYSQINSNHGTTLETRYGDEAAIYNVGHGKNNNNIILNNGKEVVPQHTDSRGSTDNIQRANGESESVHASNAGAQQTSEVTNIIKSLHILAAQLQQIMAKLVQEAAKLNLKLQ